MEAHWAGRRARARAIGWLIAGGAAMVLIWVALPHPERAHDGWVVGLVIATWVLAVALLAGRFDRVPHVVMGAVMIVAAAAWVAARPIFMQPAASMTGRITSR